VFAGFFDDLKRKIDGALKIAVAGAIASAAAMAALTCFAIVLFLWTQQNYDTLTAWTVLGALFAVVAAAGGIVALVVRNRGARRRAAELRERPREASTISRLLQEPAVLLTGLQIARSLGFRGMLPLIILAAVAGGVMTNRNGKSDPAHHHEHADQEPDEDLA